MNFINTLQQHYMHVPSALLDRSRAEEQQRAEDAEIEREAQRLRDEIKQYL